jgi:hypothetical protein
MGFGTITGIIRGRTIVLDSDIGMPEGAPVQVVLMPRNWQPGDGIRASAGSWRDLSDEEFQRGLAETYQARDEQTRTVP